MILVVGLDGADWDILDPLLERGVLPHLARLVEGGARAVLESTTPPVTFPAWSTFLTGVNPGRHGVLDFTRWEGYAVRFESGGRRRVPTVLERLAAAGRRVAAVGFPGTYPPPRLPGGFVLAGFDAPVAIAPGPGFAEPGDLYASVAREHGPWVYADIDELAVAPGWHRAARRRLLEGLERKGRIAEALLCARPWDLFAVHLGETDTVGHHFMAFHDRTSPRRPARVHPEEAAAVADVYRAADAVIGALVRAAGPNVEVLVASDHGMVAASDRVFHPNRALQAGGFVTFAAGAGEPSVLGAAQALLLRRLPARLKERLFRGLGALPSRLETRRRLGGLALSACLAFSEELTYAPSVRLNVRGREPRGLVLPEEVDGVRRAVIDHLLGLRSPGRGALVAGVRPREAALHGPATSEAPDLYLEMAAPGGHPLTVLPSPGPGPYLGRLNGVERLGGKGRGPTGVHRTEGVLVLRAERGPEGDLGRVPLGACAPTMMALLGVAPPAGLDYVSLVDRPGVPTPELVPPPPGGPYDAEGEALVASRLRALGYLA